VPTRRSRWRRLLPVAVLVELGHGLRTGSDGRPRSIRRACRSRWLRQAGKPRRSWGADDAEAALLLPLLTGSSGFVDQILRQCESGKPVKASTPAMASSGVRSFGPDGDLLAGFPPGRVDRGRCGLDKDGADGGDGVGLGLGHLRAGGGRSAPGALTVSRSSSGPCRVRRMCDGARGRKPWTCGQRAGHEGRDVRWLLCRGGSSGLGPIELPEPKRPRQVVAEHPCCVRRQNDR
jgi:hypothetical protein